MLVGVELGVGLLLVLSWSSAGPWSAAVLLAAFSAVLLWMRVTPDAPGCGCLGFRIGGPAAQENLGGLIRNLGALGCCVTMLTARASNHTAKPLRSASVAPCPQNHGFSLIELLVVIAALSVILVIVTPKLEGARGRAQRAGVMVMLSQVNTSLVLYANDYLDHFPALASSARPWEQLVLKGQTLEPGQYFNQSSYFVNLLLEDYYRNQGSVLRPWLEDEHPAPGSIIQSRALLTHAAYATPEFWRPGPPPNDLRVYQVMRYADARFPGRKGVLVDVEHAFPPMGSNAILAFFDGSAGDRVITREVHERILDARPYGAAPVISLSTLDGLNGWDF